MNAKSNIGFMRWLPAVLLSMAMIAGGCSNANNGNESAAGSTAPASTDGNGQSSIPADKNFSIKLMDWQGQNPPYQAAYDQAIADYMKLHPNVKIEHIYQPLSNNGYDKLLDTQFVSHTAPDAMQLDGGMIQKYTNQGYIMALDAYYKQPSAYAAESNWIDTFKGGEESFQPAQIANKFGVISFVPVDGGPGINSIRPFFYNKDLLDKAGVTKLPETWKEFLEVCQQLKDAGITPIAADNNRWLQWIHAWTGKQLGENYVNGFFDAKYADNADLNGTKDEIAVLAGDVNKDDPVMNAQVELVKQFSQYWQDGWAGANEQAAQQLFLYQKAAFLVDGNWNYQFYKDNISDFEWGVTPFPLITKESSPYAEEAMPKGLDSLQVYGWGINKDLEKDADKLKVVIDLFQYMTSKEVQDKFVETAVSNSPVEGVHIPDALVPFMETDKNKLKYPAGNLLFTTASKSIAFAAAQQYYTDKIDREKFMSILAQDAESMAKKTIKDELDEEIGIPATIATVEEQIADLQAENGPQSLLDAQQKALDTLKSKLELLQKDAVPLLK
ncbi:extracellular solute-binding protein [Paenibacillus sp. HB172176]|uniref:ABC transporter substrate-binding protein n=1 Tax=Paenibacillus sp. HB172176 TaxID=2493690 RepID=UPI00143A7E3B|nr:extracellular solute-binding protein [Paenibacillus sp. HB172176]